MAVDETLLNSMNESPLATLRFYQWKTPTLSLGYFQSAHDREQHQASVDVDMVRRLSGGGAILHDHELTYSLILPEAHPSVRDVHLLYDLVHETIVVELRKMISKNKDWHIALWTQKREAPPFLCFQRRFVGDIVLENSEQSIAHKVAGSAQRRRSGHILQHGSILLRKSDVAPELPGIFDLTGVHIEPKWLATQLSGMIATKLHLNLVESAISHHLSGQAEDLAKGKYLCENWTKRR